MFAIGLPQPRGEGRGGDGGREVSVQPPGRAFPEQSQQIGTRLACVVSEQNGSRAQRPRRGGRAFVIKSG